MMRPVCLSALALVLGTSTEAQASSAMAGDLRSPEAVALQVALEGVCLPLAKGRPMKTLAANAGVRERNEEWVMPIRGREAIVLSPPTEANPNLCAFTITYPAGQQAPLLELLNNWASGRGLSPVKVREASRGPVRKRWASTWEGVAEGGVMAIVFSEERTLAGEPLGGSLDTATVMLSLSRAASQAPEGKQ
jgi:hypothetical protein